MRNWLNSGISSRRRGVICLPRVMPLFLLEGHQTSVRLVPLLPAQVLAPIAVEEGGGAAPGVLDPDAAEHGGDLVEDLLLARSGRSGFNLPQRPFGLRCEVVPRQQWVRIPLAPEEPPDVPPVFAHQHFGL